MSDPTHTPTKVTWAMIDAQKQDVACLERQLARAKSELRALHNAYNASRKEDLNEKS